MRTKESAAELEHRRQLAIERLHEGHSTEEVAEFLGIHIRTVQKWKARHDKQGDAGLASKPALGRMPKLTDRQTETVLSWFTRSPREFGYRTPAEFAATCTASVRATPSLPQHMSNQMALLS